MCRDFTVENVGSFWEIKMRTKRMAWLWLCEESQPPVTKVELVV
jgi:hypothetical protein